MAAVKKKLTAASIALLDIQDKEVSVKEPEEKFKARFKKEKLRLGLKVNFETNDDDTILLNIRAAYDYELDGELKSLLKSAFSFHYAVKNLQEITRKDNDSELPEELVLTLISISLSTMRGLIAAKTRGYFINKFYIPIISPKQLASKFVQ